MYELKYDWITPMFCTSRTRGELVHRLGSINPFNDRSFSDDFFARWCISQGV